MRPAGWLLLLALQKEWVVRIAFAAALRDSCDVEERARVDCFEGEEQCVARGCCWAPVSPNPDNVPWCFQQGGGPAPAPPHPTRRASAFVHLFEWSWIDIALECEEWLGPKGFTAVQISPPNEHRDGQEWWVRYQPVTYKLQSRSGDEEEFRDMVRRCRDVGVDIYADAVFNHIAAGTGTGTAGSSFGSRATPIYGPDDMHHAQGDSSRNCGVDNYDDKHNVQYCDLEGLPDLCTSCSHVQQTVADYLNQMIDIGIAGFRVDAAKHQDAVELGQLLARLQKKVFVFQEVISGENEAVQPSMYYSTGEVTEFDYPRKLAPNFKEEGKLQYLSSFGESWGLMPRPDALVFIDNHDTQRGEAELTYRDGQLYQLASIFMLAHPYGYPKVMSSYTFDSHDQGPPSTPVHDHSGRVRCAVPGAAASAEAGATSWVCEHRWLPIANMVAWRRSAGENLVTSFQAPGGDTIALCRGPAACVALNRQEQATWTVRLKLSLPEGRYCDIIRSDDVSSCPTVSVAADGSADLEVPPLRAVALHTGKMAPESLFV